jgi:hypothetical protein
MKRANSATKDRYALTHNPIRRVCTPIITSTQVKQHASIPRYDAFLLGSQTHATVIQMTQRWTLT